MSDDNIIGIDRPDPTPNPDGPASGKITETIAVPLSADMTPSQHAKFLRSIANLLHAYISNVTRYAAIGEGRNVGAGAQVIQQVFGATANIDAAAMNLEAGQRQVLTGPMPPPPHGGMGRA